jgi:membrane-bound metal-dependent hydrolase YbcI (DUF457 family)
MKKLLAYLSGSSRDHGFEHCFMNLITLLAGFSALLTLFINFYLEEMPRSMFWIILSLGVFFLWNTTSAGSGTCFGWLNGSPP